MDEEVLEEEVEGEKMSKTCFVTGGTGFLGFSVLQELVKQDWQITLLFYTGDKDILKKRLFEFAEGDEDQIRKDQLRIVEGNILKVESIREAMPDNVDSVFHMAGSIVLNDRLNKMQTMINVEGTRNALKVAVEKGARRFIHTSSTAVYGENPNDLLINEESPKEAMIYALNYGKSKYTSEKLVLEESKKGRMDCVCIQPNFILGEGDIIGQGFTLLYNKVGRKTIPAVPPGGGSFGDIKEIARAHVSAFENGRNGECYLLGGDYRSHKQFIALIAKELKIDKYPKFVPPKWPMYYLISLMECAQNCIGNSPKLTTQQFLSTSRFVRIDSTKAEKELGFKITPVEELVKRQIKYMKDNHQFNTDIVY